MRGLQSCVRFPQGATVFDFQQSLAESKAGTVGEIAESKLASNRRIHRVCLISQSSSVFDFEVRDADSLGPRPKPYV
eukprot:2965292-Rhodomonas_salina.2